MRSNSIPLLKKYFVVIAWILYIAAYTIAGLVTFRHLLGSFPLVKPLGDFAIYEKAVTLALEGKSPYFVYHIGAGFLYPPAALLFIEPFAHIRNFSLRAFLFIALNFLLILFIVVRLAKRFALKNHALLFLTLFFAVMYAPFQELIYVGQINLIVLAGIFIMFEYEQSNPWLSGLGLAVAVLLKLTPALLILYLAANRRIKEIGTFLLFILFFSLLSIFRYGFGAWLEFPAVLQWLSVQFPLDTNSQTTIANLLDFVWRMQYRFDPTPNFWDVDIFLWHRILLAFLGSVSLLTAGWYFFNKEKFSLPNEPLFIMLLLTMTLMPNVIWYHHYVFLMVPFVLWIYWQKFNLDVVLWCSIALLAIQIDRFYLTGGLIINAVLYISLVVLLVSIIRFAKTANVSSARRTQELIEESRNALHP
ncbi:MAG: glycosyltransferase family 87 protein [Chloroflexota bacterium]